MLAIRVLEATPVFELTLVAVFVIVLVIAAEVILVCEVITDVLDVAFESATVEVVIGPYNALNALPPPFATMMEDSLAKTLEMTI